MDLLIVLPILILLLAGWAATAISRVVHKSLVRSKNANAKLFHVLTWFGSFILIAGATFLLLIYNIRLER